MLFAVLSHSCFFGVSYRHQFYGIRHIFLNLVLKYVSFRYDDYTYILQDIIMNKDIKNIFQIVLY